MNRLPFILLFALFSTISSAQVLSKYKRNETVTYEEAIGFYKEEAAKSDIAHLFEYGETDAGKPLHLMVISKDKDFDPQSLRKKGKCIILVNNGIHAGEPCGIDASMKLVQELLNWKVHLPHLDNVVIAFIPVYNVGGMLNRNKFSRANQNGPVEHGFRGNAKNLDLNRDFIKADSRNAKAFTQLFQEWSPDILIDTHTSNGADYQYVMTMLTTQRDKLHPEVGRLLHEEMLPELYDKMEMQGYPMTPYVMTVDKTPDSGIKDYLETPRYSTGYAALFNTIGFTSETHMFKPYEDRVKSTYEFIKTVFIYANTNSREIIERRKVANELIAASKEFPLNWELDTSSFTTIDFRGYEAEYRPSAVHDTTRLFYNREKPFNKKIRYYNRFRATDIVIAPDFYIIPQAWQAVIDRFELNKIDYTTLEKDTVMEVEVYYILDYKTKNQPYEGHYLHFDTKVRREKQQIQYHAGDLLIPVNQEKNRFIVETLEPQAVDSYFNWNFFDPILQQKEWFSAYVFEDIADSLLKNDPNLKADFEKKKEGNTAFATNVWQQLYFIYQRSPYYEKEHMRYPVGRLTK